jgi:sugar transferase (PEP-CTERM/EpsH1 system associated)
MDDLLFLAHRIPYPPNKGDKLRSYHLLRHLAKRYRVHVGTFVDDKADWQYTCAVKDLAGGDALFLPLSPRRGKLRSAIGLVTGEALALPYYRDARMARWVEATIERHDIKRVVVFSSPMAQYVNELEDIDRLVDYVDVDSDKWKQYAQASDSKVMSWLYQREADRLLEFERYTASRAIASVFVTHPESALFRRLAGDLVSPVITVENGVDADFFNPTGVPLPAGWTRGRGEALNHSIVFTGAMDYRPNIDAAVWFSREVLPLVRHQVPDANFWIVGARPSTEVRSLARADEVFVTGTVAEVRPYLAHAGVVVVPMRLARGIQNKALEAMAMGAAAVVSATSAAALNATPSRDFVLADDAESFARAVIALFNDPAQRETLGAAGRAAVLENYDWSRNLARIERCFDSGFDRSVDRLFEAQPRAERDDASATMRMKRRVPPGPFLATEVEHA